MKFTEERIAQLEKTVESLIEQNRELTRLLQKTSTVADNVGAMLAATQILLYREGIVDPEKAAKIFKDYDKQRTIDTLEKGFAS